VYHHHPSADGGPTLRCLSTHPRSNYAVVIGAAAHGATAVAECSGEGPLTERVAAAHPLPPGLLFLPQRRLWPGPRESIGQPGKMVYRGGCGSALDAEVCSPFCDDQWIEVASISSIEEGVYPQPCGVRASGIHTQWMYLSRSGPWAGNGCETFACLKIRPPAGPDDGQIGTSVGRAGALRDVECRDRPPQTF